MDENAGRNDKAAEERVGCGASSARRRAAKRRRRAGALALALAAACLGALAGGGAASALYWVGTVASLPAAEVAPAEWARCYEDGACYDQSDGWGSYYVRYAGSAAKVDAAAALDADGKLCGTVIGTTEHMFQGLDPNVTEIELPDVSGFDGGVHPDTFGGDLDHEVDLRYRDKDGADRCSALDGSTDAGKATVWLYLEEGNLEKYLVFRTYKGEAKNVYVSESVESLKSLFISNKSIVSCSISDEGTWDSANRMLANCTSLTTLPDGFFNIPVTDTDYMFYRCTSLETIPDGFLSNTSGLIHTYDMFYGCASLKTIPVGFLSDAPSLSNTYDMFAGCTNLESLPEGFLSNAPKIYSIGSMFNGCTSLASLPEGFLANSSNLKEMKEAFSGCNALASLPSGLSLAEGATSVSSAFSDCASLTVDAIPAGFKLPSTVTDAHELFNGCISLEAVPDGLLSNAASLQNASSMFAGTGDAAVPDGLLDGTPNLTDASAMFQGAPIATVPENLFKNNGKLADVSSLFSNCGQLVGTLDLPSSVATADNMVDGAGASAATHPYDDKGKDAGDTGAYSVIVRYDRSAATDSMKAYIDGVNATAGVRARFVPYLWEKVPSDDGPYEDPATNGKFYLRYTGSDPIVDVQDHLDENGAIRGVKVATTDRMFQGLDPNVGEVVLPNVSGFATNVDPNTFGGDLSHKVDLRYRASLEDAEDHCSTLNAADAAKATAWLYLEDSNLEKNGSYKTYKGKARNVYVSRNVTSLQSLFKSNASIVSFDTDVGRNEWSSTLNMFNGCTSLANLPAGFLSPAPALKVAAYMFAGCTSLRTVPAGFLSRAPFLTGTSSMFKGCTSLESLPNGFLSDASFMQNTDFMFEGCTSLASLPNGFMSKRFAVNAEGMFYGCASLASLPEGWKVSNGCKNLDRFFNGCSKLQGEFVLSNNVTQCMTMLVGTSSEVESSGLIYDDNGVDVGEGKGSYAFVVRYPAANSALSTYAATVNAHGTGYEKVVMVPISGAAMTAELEPEAEDPQPEATEVAPVEDAAVGVADDAQADAPEKEGGEVVPPLDEAVPDDALDEPLPEGGAQGDVPADPPLPDDPEVEPLPEDEELVVPAPVAPEEPADEPEVTAGDEARVMVRPEREEGLLSADPPGIVAVAAGGLGVGEYFRRRRDGSKGQD